MESRFPGEIRFGEQIYHKYPVSVLWCNSGNPHKINSQSVLIVFCILYWIRLIRLIQLDPVKDDQRLLKAFMCFPLTM